MYYVYILKILLPNITKELYVGFAEGLRDRFKKHEQGLIKPTRHIRPLKLIYYEAYSSKRDALIRKKG